MGFGTYAIGSLPYGDGTGGSSIIYYDIALVSPASGSTASGFYPTFTSLPNSSDGSTIQIEWGWDTDPSFTNLTSQQQLKTTTGNATGVNASTAPNGALYNGPIYWRTRAGDGTNWSSYSTIWTLNVLTIPTYSSAYAYENVGLPPTPATTDGTSTAYVNTGLAAGTRQTIIRQPRGWGVIPTGPQTIIILTEASAGTAEAYENIQ